MGGTNSVEQVREFVKTGISKTVTETVNTKTTDVTQKSTINQTIEGVTVLQKPNCPFWESSRGSVDLSNLGKVTMSSVSNLRSLNSMDLTKKLTKNIEDSVHSSVTTEKSGWTP